MFFHVDGRTVAAGEVSNQSTGFSFDCSHSETAAMSIWVRVFCQESVAGVTPEQMRAGIAKRLRLLTYLFCPEDEEVPD